MVQHNDSVFGSGVNIYLPLLVCVLFISIYSSTLLAAQAGQQEPLPLSVRQKLLSGEVVEVLPQLKAFAAQGNNQARYQLARYYLDAQARGQVKVVESDIKEARQLLEQAAAKNAKAAYLMASLYYKGQQLARDLIKAEQYFTLAAELGHAKAEVLLKLIFADKGKSAYKQQQQAFFVAVKAGKLNETKALVSRGADINVSDNHGDTALLSAIRHKHSELALWLIKQGASLAAQDRKGNSALHLAINLHLPRVAHQLITLQKNLDLPNQQRQTPLMLAIVAGQINISQSLVNAGVSLSATDQTGTSAAEYAKIHKMELRFKAEKNSDQTLSIAQENAREVEGLKAQLQALASQAKDSQSPYYNWPLLAMAVAQKQSAVSKYLLKGGVNILQENPHKESAVTIAIKRQDLAVLELLFASGQKGLEQKQVIDILKAATGQDNLELFTLVAGFIGEQVLASLPKQQDALSQAILSDAVTLIPYLLEKNWFSQSSGSVVIRHTQGAGLAPGYLLQASKLNRSAIALLLLVQTPEVDLQDKDERTPLWYAARHGDQALLASLINVRGIKLDQADSRGLTPLMQAVINDCFVCVDILLAKGADVNKASLKGNSAIMFAAQGKNQILRRILNQDVDISRRNDQSYTPLLLAVKSDNSQGVKLLLGVGANANRKNAHGQNAFSMAKFKPEILKLLTNP